MYTHGWSFAACCATLRTARQKKRLQKKDADRQLIRLDRRWDELRRQQRLIPLVPLEEPYQRGWKRTFVLRDDVARSSQAAFYETLLQKINTVDYAPDKAFMQRKKRKRKKVYEVRPQYLRSFYLYELHHPRYKLTDMEKALFYPEEHLSKDGKTTYIKFVYGEPWRFVLRVRPHMITHVKAVDEVLEQQLQHIQSRIDNHHLLPRMLKLTRGRSWRCRHSEEREQYKNPLRNKPLHSIMAAVYNEEL